MILDDPNMTFLDLLDPAIAQGAVAPTSNLVLTVIFDANFPDGAHVSQCMVLIIFPQ